MFNEKVHVMNHPLVSHKLTIMRDKNTSVKDFRELVSEIGMLITYEATRDLPLQPKLIQTPIGPCNANELAGRKMAIIPILRAGLGMVDGILNLVPSAKVGHIGMFRDPETHAPVPYYCKLPHDVEERDVLVLDPMLATGGSAVDAINQVKKYNIRLFFLNYFIDILPIVCFSDQIQLFIIVYHFAKQIQDSFIVVGYSYVYSTHFAKYLLSFFLTVKNNYITVRSHLQENAVVKIRQHFTKLPIFSHNILCFYIFLHLHTEVIQKHTCESWYFKSVCKHHTFAEEQIINIQSTFL